jgi:hypothetical protein
MVFKRGASCSVLEVVEACCGGTYWGVYSVRYVAAVHVLHCCRQLTQGIRRSGLSAQRAAAVLGIHWPELSRVISDG